MDKIKMAHEYAMQAIDTGYVCETDTLVSEAWNYADLMQIESDKRSITGVPEVISNAGVDGARGLFVGFQGKPKKIKIDWQPDFSKVPDWANWCVLRFEDIGVYRELYCECEPEFRIEKNNWYSVVGRSTYGLPVTNSNINHADFMRKRT